MTVLASLSDVLLDPGWFDSPSTALTESRVIALALSVALALVAYAVARYLLVRRTIGAIAGTSGQLATRSSALIPTGVAE